MPQRLEGPGSFRMVWNGTVRVTEAWDLPLARILLRSAGVSLESVGAAGWPPSCRTGSSRGRNRTRRVVTPETPLFRRGLELTGQPAVCRPSLPVRRARGSAPAAGMRLRGKHPSGRGGTGRQGPPSRWGPMARGQANAEAGTAEGQRAGNARDRPSPGKGPRRSARRQWFADPGTRSRRGSLTVCVWEAGWRRSRWARSFPQALRMPLKPQSGAWGPATLR